MKNRFGKNKTTDTDPSTPNKEKVEDKMVEEKVKKERKPVVRRTPKQKLTDALNNAGVELRGMFGCKDLTMEQANKVIELCQEYEALGKKILNTLFPAV